jgi:endonuclease/exonuclease/phosphatase family metal-dependent hydrolase
MRELTTATWNVHGGLDEDWRPFPFAERLAGLGADVVGLQELELSGEPEPSGFEYTIAKGFSDSPFSAGGELAVGLLSAAPIVRSESVTLPNPVRALDISPEFHDKGLIVSQVLWSGIAIDVIVLHLFPFHRVALDARDPVLRPLWDEIDEHLRPRPGVPRLVLGDFNTPHRLELLSCARRGELRGLFPGPSDDILVSAHWKARRCENVPTESDHKLLLASLTLE